MPKISCVGIEARNRAIAGLSFVAKQVKESIGPFGLNHGSEKGDRISNDGAFIADRLIPTIQNEFERRGAIMVSKSVNRINEEIGDGSSTAWALHEAIAKECVRYLPNEKTIKAKKTYSEVARMLEKSKENVIKKLEAKCAPVTTEEQLIKSALVSSEDENIAKLLGVTQWEMGPEGRIVAEESNDKVSSIVKTEGILLDNGFVSSNLVTNPEKQTLEINNPMPILLTNYTIGEPEMKLLRENVLKTLAQQKKGGCIVMARAFTPEAIKESHDNFKSFPVILINAPFVDQREAMRDIEAVVGGRYIDSEESSLNDIYITDIGCAGRIVARSHNAQIAGVKDETSKARIEKRLEILKKKLSGTLSPFEHRMISERIAQLTDGFAILKVGSQSEADRKRLFDKAEDAVNSVRLALKGGTVKGAGQALKEISEELEEDDILKRPLSCIYDQIMGSAPEDWAIPEWVEDNFIGLKTILEKTCAFVPTFVSLNSLDTEENPPKCKCNEKQAS